MIFVSFTIGNPKVYAYLKIQILSLNFVHGQIRHQELNGFYI